MISRSSKVLETVDSESSETENFLQPNPLKSAQQIICTSLLNIRFKSICLSSKPVYLILVWTLIVNVVYATVICVAAGFISNSINGNINPFSNTNPITSPFCITQALLAFTAVLYPLSGFLLMFGVGDSKQS